MTVAADPYPWPFDGALDAGRLALVIAGNQPAWSRRSVGGAEVAAVIGTVAATFRSMGSAVVHVRHGRSSWRRGGLPPVTGDPAWDLASRPHHGDLVVDAAGIDGFYGSALDHVLRSRGIDTLVLSGYGEEAAVSSTLRSANDRGYECLTLTDGVAPFDVGTGRCSRHSTTMSGGIFGAVAPSEALLAALSHLTALSPAEALT